MAALGAAAGAFEGDNAREEQRARRAGLGLQAAQLAQQERQFVDRQTLEREQMAIAEAENAQKRQDNIDALSMQQFNADRRMKLDEKQVAIGQENDLYQRGREQVQDAWKSALDEQTIKEKQLEYETHQAEFSKYKAAQDKELEQLANREKMAKNGMSYLMQLAYMSPTGVVAKEAVSLFNKENGTNMSGAYLDKNTGNFITEEIGQDGKPVQVPVDRVKQENFLRTWVGDGVADSFFKRSDDAEKNAFNLKRDASKEQAEMARVTAGLETRSNAYSEKRHEGLLMRKGELESDLEAEKDPEKRKAITRKIDMVKSTIDSILLGDSAQGASAPSDFVTIRAPDGSIGKVKRGSEQKYLSKPGFSIVK